MKSHPVIHHRIDSARTITACLRVVPRSKGIGFAWSADWAMVTCPKCLKQRAIELQHLKREAEFIASRSEWPRWPSLPLKRKSPSGDLDVGFLHADTASPEDGFLVYCTDIFSWKSKTHAEREAVKRIHYPSVDAMQADGWRVD